MEWFYSLIVRTFDEGIVKEYCVFEIRWIDFEEVLRGF